MIRPPDISRRTLRLLQVAVALALLTVLALTVDLAETGRLLADADFGWILAAMTALTLQTLLSALRWRLTAGRLGQQMSARKAIGEYYLSQAVNQSLPGGMVGDAGRAVRARHHAGLLRSGQAVVFERVAGQAALFAVMALAVLVVTLLPGGLDLPRWVLGPLALGLGCLLALILLIGLGAPLAGWVGKDLRETFVHAVLHPSVLPAQVVLSLGTTACNLAAFAFCARATGTMLGSGAVLTLVPLILATMLIPISVSGWGLREGAAAALFPLAGASASGGLAASVAFGLVFLAAVLPGLLHLVFGSGHETARPGRKVGPIDAGQGRAAGSTYSRATDP